MDACTNCELLPTKFAEASEPNADRDDEIEQLIFQASLIVEAEDGGLRTNWNLYEPELAELVIEYRKAEKELKTLFEIRQQQFIKAHFKKG